MINENINYEKMKIHFFQQNFKKAPFSSFSSRSGNPAVVSTFISHLTTKVSEKDNLLSDMNCLHYIQKTSIKRVIAQ